MGFAPDWLALRAPADRRGARRDLAGARGAGVAGGAASSTSGRRARRHVRAMTRSLPTGRAGRLVDNDAGLLALAPRLGGRVRTFQADLTDLEARCRWTGAGLVTASALLDLVSQRLAGWAGRALGAHGLPFYAALSYDGQMSWDPAARATLPDHRGLQPRPAPRQGLWPGAGPGRAARGDHVLRGGLRRDAGRQPVAAWARGGTRCRTNCWTASPCGGAGRRRRCDAWLDARAPPCGPRRRESATRTCWRCRRKGAVMDKADVTRASGNAFSTFAPARGCACCGDWTAGERAALDSMPRWRGATWGRWPSARSGSRWTVAWRPTRGDARDISGPDGLRHLHRLRALSDAVVIGVRHGAARHAAIDGAAVFRPEPGARHHRPARPLARRRPALRDDGTRRSSCRGRTPGLRAWRWCACPARPMARCAAPDICRRCMRGLRTRVGRGRRDHRLALFRGRAAVASACRGGAAC